MAEEAAVVETTETEPPKKSGGMLKAILFMTLGMVCGAGGFAVPLVFPGMFGGKEEVVAEEKVDEDKVKTALVEFGETVVNLNSDRLNRYLRVKITFLVKEDDQETITQLVEDQGALLKSWLLSYLSDISMDDIRGAAGQNRLRREIQDHFNTLLFDDGYDRIRDLLFEEFSVQ